MTPALRRYASGQDGYTLVEVVIACAIGAIVMTGLTSVVLTSIQASNIASNRLDASAQIRNFEFFASDDFARSSAPSPSGCGTGANPCTTQPIVLSGLQVTNAAAPVAAPYQVSYTWDGTQFVDRQVGGSSPIHAMTSVTAFSWYLDTSALHPTVVVSMTITVGAYQESQTLRFLPQVGS